MILLTPPLAPFENGCVLAAGVFDGVHPGHRLLLARAKELAVSYGLPLAVFTFRNVPQKGGSIITNAEKLLLLEQNGADAVFCADFDEYRGTDAETFAKETVAGVFAARAFVCGGDFRFGSGRAGDAGTLARFVPLVVTVPEYRIDGAAVSSSLIREKLRAGDIAAASALLGREYSFCFKTVRGARLGTKLGFPTANQRFPQGMCVPRYGVYAGKCVTADGRGYGCVLDIGVKPTVSDDPAPGCETHIFGEPVINYGDELRVFPQTFIRGERAFGSEAELADAVRRDIAFAKESSARENAAIKDTER